MVRWPAEPYIPAMTTDDLHALASRIVERMIREHPDEAAVLVSLVLSEILSLGLFGGDDDEVTGFADAVNAKLGEIALSLGASRSFQLVRADPPTRQ
jgi:hypothetical protein